MRPLKICLAVIAGFQAVLGAAFLLVPSATASLFGLEPAAPGWVHWLFAMMGARFLGYAYGMAVAFRDPAGSLPWIDSMIAIQTIDWVATMLSLSAGDVNLQQVATASFVPLIFVAVLVWFHPRRLARLDAAGRSAEVSA